MPISFDGFDAFERFTRFTEHLATVVELPFVIAAEATSYILQENVKKVHGDSSKLAHLAPSTQEERVSLGYTPDDPLLRNAKLLRDNVERFHEGKLAAVGSSQPVAAYQEFGYMNVRAGRFVGPRPAFEIGLHDSEERVRLLVDEAISAALGFGVMTHRSE